jgi:hypothetical protein
MQKEDLSSRLARAKKKVRTYLKNNLKQKGWRYGSSGRVLA